jgi:nicotinamide-nucleotide amidase
MARGALANSRAQVSIAITGIAGPGGGSAHKPVGMVCFAWAIRKNNAIKQNSITKQFKGNRQKIREQACKYAVHQTLEFLNKL